MTSFARLTAFEVGQIKAHAYHGLGAAAISRIVFKADGKTHPSEHGVKDVLDKLQRKPTWRGERDVGSGRWRLTTPAVDKKIKGLVFRYRGKAKVTVSFIKKRIPPLREFSDSLVQDRLQEAGLQWMRRRKKSLVPKTYLQARCEFAERVKRMRQASLDGWAYSDGTVIYLDKTEEDNEHRQRAALGSHVWRMSNHKDALWSECIGPSAYNKAQGMPVRIWGVLAAGRLSITILPPGQAMNRWWYAWIIKHYFPRWLGPCHSLIQDYERCLRCEEPLAAMKEIGLALIEDYPRCSQDLNAIENAWQLLKDRLNCTLPRGLESREEFIKRLKNAVAWVNTNQRDALQKQCTNQKERAAEVLLRSGGRTSF